MLVQLTAAGRRFLDNMLPDHFRRLAGLMHGVGASDRRVLRRIAGTIAANVATLSADPADPTKRKR
jgi:DNA-binding MarR family transcriptional regulator